MRTGRAACFGLFIATFAACVGDDPVASDGTSSGGAADGGSTSSSGSTGGAPDASAVLSIAPVPTIAARAGSPATITVVANRGGVVGPLRASATQLPEGVTVPQADIGADATQVQLTLSVVPNTKNARTRITLNVTSEQGAQAHVDADLIVQGAAGTLDDSVSPGGMAVTSSEALGFRDDVVDAEGRLYLLVDVKDESAIYRHLPTGALDTTFGDNGHVAVPTPDATASVNRRALAFQGDKLVVAGTVFEDAAAMNHPFVMRLGADFALDPTFGTAGIWTGDDTPTADAATPSVVSEMFVDASQRIRLVLAPLSVGVNIPRNVVTLTLAPDAPSIPAVSAPLSIDNVARWQTDPAGRLWAAFSQPVSAVDNNVIVALARFDATGAPDEAFGTRTGPSLAQDANASVGAGPGSLTFHTDGSAVIPLGNYAFTSGRDKVRAGLARWNPATEAIAAPWPSPEAYPELELTEVTSLEQAAFDATGQVFVAGYWTHQSNARNLLVAQLGPGGAPVPGFAESGYARFALSSYATPAVHVQPDGLLVVSATDASVLSVVRIWR